MKCVSHEKMYISTVEMYWKYTSLQLKYTSLLSGCRHLENEMYILS